MTSGFFWFAWVNAGEAFSAGTHSRRDENIISWRLEQTEGEFASLTIDVKNPKIGLLAPGRKVWAWFSFEGAPLILCRLVGIPNSINKEVVSLVFQARPIDFQDQKVALAETLKVAPYYDLLYIAEDKENDVDAVLEARTQLWHIDPITHVVSVSDLLTGEDGTEVFEEFEVPYESVDITIGQPPIRAVKVTADAPWSQSSKGRLAAFKDLYVNTKAGEGLINGWPKPGASIGGGWSAVDQVTFLSANVETVARSVQSNLTDDDLIFGYGGGSVTLPDTVIDPVFLTAYSASSSSSGVTSSSTAMGVINWDVYCSLALGYDTGDRKRKDTLTFTLTTDFQALVTLPDDSEVLELTVSSRDVGLPVNLPDSTGTEIPIGLATRRSFFPQERGQQSIKYLLMLARAHIVMRSRAVQVKFNCTFERALELSLRKNAILFDPRLPGGEALGKIIAYAISMQGGQLIGEVTMGCAIGKGGTLPVRTGDATVAEEAVFEAGIQVYVNQLTHVTEDIAYTVLSENAVDDGIVFPLQRIPYASDVLVNTVETVPFMPGIPTVSPRSSTDDCGNTTSISLSMSLDTSPITAWLGGIKTTVDFALKPVTGGPFESPYELEVEPLIIPKMIDLEAAELSA